MNPFGFNVGDFLAYRIRYEICCGYGLSPNPTDLVTILTSNRNDSIFVRKEISRCVPTQTRLDTYRNNQIFAWCGNAPTIAAIFVFSIGLASFTGIRVAIARVET
jgi:hypothetical protein